MNWHNQVKSYLKSIIRDEVISTFDGKSITILGGTGFIGKWIVSTMLEAKVTGYADIEIHVVARDMNRVKEFFPVSDGLINIIEQDLSSRKGMSALPRSDFFVYAATPTKPSSGLRDGLGLSLESNYGLDLILNSAEIYQNCPRVLHLSSGIVYGVHRNEDKPISETNDIRIEDVPDVYYHAKLLIEKRLVEATMSGMVHAGNARLFAFAGPGLSINDHFAVGNFMSDILEERDILIRGNPQSKRSYMHPIDLTLWLLKILNSPTLEPINVGSDRSITIMELAEIIRRISPSSNVSILNENAVPNFYYPETRNTRKTYGLRETIELEAGLADWYQFLKNTL